MYDDSEEEADDEEVLEALKEVEVMVDARKQVPPAASGKKKNFLTYLRANPRTKKTNQELAELFGVTDRTIYRWKEEFEIG